MYKNKSIKSTNKGSYYCAVETEKILSNIMYHITQDKSFSLDMGDRFISTSLCSVFMIRSHQLRNMLL